MKIILIYIYLFKIRKNKKNKRFGRKEGAGIKKKNKK